MRKNRETAVESQRADFSLDAHVVFCGNEENDDESNQMNVDSLLFL